MLLFIEAKLKEEKLKAESPHLFTSLNSYDFPETIHPNLDDDEEGTNSLYQSISKDLQALMNDTQNNEEGGRT